MSAEVFITRAKPWEVQHVARRLRISDRLEIENYGSESAEGVLAAHRALNPEETFVLRFEAKGDPAVLFGCHWGSPGVGVPWAVGTEEIGAHPVAFHAAALRHVEEWRHRFGYLSNLVWAHSSSIPWLQRLGFVVGDEIAWKSPVGGEFVRFEMLGAA